MHFEALIVRSPDRVLTLCSCPPYMPHLSIATAEIANLDGKILESTLLTTPTMRSQELRHQTLRRRDSKKTLGFHLETTRRQRSFLIGSVVCEYAWAVLVSVSLCEIRSISTHYRCTDPFKATLHLFSYNFAFVWSQMEADTHSWKE